MSRLLCALLTFIISPVVFAHPGHSWDILPHPYHHYLTDGKFLFIVSIITIAVIAYYLLHSGRK